MFEFIEGTVSEKSPAHLVLNVNGIGYFIHISLNTYSELQDENPVKVLIHQIIREDAHVLFGFARREERDIFRLLISVSGIGANTARVILSSMSPGEVGLAILEGNVVSLQSIKGIGAKTAQRIIVDLKDKVGKAGQEDELFLSERNTLQQEALSALVALGFAKKQVEKVLAKITTGKPGLSVQEVIKQALKLL